MEKKLENIVRVARERYNKNLAGIVIFGSYFEGNYIEESDIDTIILLKEKLDLERDGEESRRLREGLKKENLSIQIFSTLKDIEKKIYEVGKWTTRITILKGLVIYSTPEFEKFRERLRKRNIDKKILIKHLKEKDEFDLGEYLEKAEGFKKTVCLFGHIRRKLQILNYYSDMGLEFSYNVCLRNLKGILEKYTNILRKLEKDYIIRKILTEGEIKDYAELAKELMLLVERTFKI